MARFAQLAAVLAAASLANARAPFIKERQVPADPTGVTTITSAAGAKITYKQPGKAGVCETTEGTLGGLAHTSLARLLVRDFGTSSRSNGRDAGRVSGHLTFLDERRASIG